MLLSTSHDTWDPLPSLVFLTCLLRRHAVAAPMNAVAMRRRPLNLRVTVHCRKRGVRLCDTVVCASVHVLHSFQSDQLCHDPCRVGYMLGFSTLRREFLCTVSAVHKQKCPIKSMASAGRFDYNNLFC